MGVPFNLSRGDYSDPFLRADHLRAQPRVIAPLLFGGLILAGLFLRVYAIGRLPGINGDEAWYGVAATDLASGWRLAITPNGNPIGPLQFGELAILHLFFAPSVAVLRIPSLLSSLGAIILGYFVGKRIGGKTTAWPVMLIMAVLPMNIAYARLGWDPSHSGFLILLATFLLLSGRHLVSAALFAVSLLVHPTNLFAAPFLLFVRAGQALDQHGECWGREIRTYAIMLLTAIAGFFAVRAGAGGIVDPSTIMQRLFDPSQYVEFVRLFGDLLTGETVYRFVVGKGMGTIASPLAWLAVALLILLMLSRIHLRSFDVKQGIMLGWVASVATFFVLAGPIAIRPHFERYGFVLIAPTALALAVMIAPWVDRRGVQWLLGGAGAAALAGFLLFFISPLGSGHDDAHRAFRTGPVEPKAAAAAALKSFAIDRPIEVIPEDFWLYLPTDYLVHGKQVRVRSPEDNPGEDASRAAVAFWLVYRGSPTEHRVQQAGRHRLVWASQDQRGRQIRIWRPN